MGKIEFAGRKKAFIASCNEYAKKVEQIKLIVINNDIAISTPDLMDLVKQKKTADSLLRNAYCFKYFGIPVHAKAIPLYGDITDMYHIWRNSLSFPVLHQMNNVHNYDIFSLDEDNFPCVDMLKAEAIANELYVKQYGKDIEMRLNVLESIAKGLSSCNGEIDWADIKRYIEEDDTGAFIFDKTRYLASII